MERNTEPSMETLWSRCRIVGFVNLIICVIDTIILLLMMAAVMFMIFTIQKKESEADKNEENGMVDDLIRNQSVLAMILIYSIFIIILIILIFFIRVNYGITSETAPDNGVKTGRWLIYHKVLFCLCIVFGILTAIGKRLTRFISFVISLIRIMCAPIFISVFYDTFFRFSIIDIEDKTTGAQYFTMDNII